MADDPTRRFAALVGDAGRPPPLDEALLLVAAHAHPGLNVPGQLHRLDQLAAGVREPTLDGLRSHLFDELGFQGDRVTYEDPVNSLLPDVLDRRRGIPITLAVVAIEVGRRCGVPLAGVGMPGHFLAASVAEPGRYLDAFHDGRVLDVEGCRAVFDGLGAPGPWDERYLDPSPPLAIVARVLTNLVHAFRRAGDRAGLCWALSLRLEVPGATETDRRELGVLLGASGRFDEGADVLEVSDEPRDQAAAARLRARLN